MKWDEGSEHEVCTSIDNINSVINSWVVMLTWPLEKISMYESNFETSVCLIVTILGQQDVMFLATTKNIYHQR